MEIYFGECFIVPCGKFWSRQPQEQCYPFLSVCAVCLCVQTMLWLPVFGIFNVLTDVDACDCTRGLYRHCKSLHWKLALGEKNPLPHQGLEAASVLCLAFQSDALPTELSPPHCIVVHHHETECHAKRLVCCLEGCHCEGSYDQNSLLLLYLLNC